MRFRSAIAAVAMLASTACTGGASGAANQADGSVAGASATDASTTSAPADAGPSLGESPDSDAGTTGCPPEPPRPFGRCIGELRDCTYGSDPLAVCRPRYQCFDGTWRSVTWTSCDVLDSCPDGPDASVCSPGGNPCFTSDARVCHCRFDTDGGSYWSCRGAGVGCPVLAPNMGTPCSPPDDGGVLACRYGPDNVCGPDFSIVCTGGTWQGVHDCTE